MNVILFYDVGESDCDDCCYFLIQPLNTASVSTRVIKPRRFFTNPFASWRELSHHTIFHLHAMKNRLTGPSDLYSSCGERHARVIYHRIIFTLLLFRPDTHHCREKTEPHPSMHVIINRSNQLSGPFASRWDLCATLESSLFKQTNK